MPKWNFRHANLKNLNKAFNYTVKVVRGPMAAKAVVAAVVIKNYL